MKWLALIMVSAVAALTPISTASALSKETASATAVAEPASPFDVTSGLSKETASATAVAEPASPFDVTSGLSKETASATAVAEPASPFDVTPVSDADLQAQRGGIRLPNGIDVALSVQTQTAVDGSIVLRTIFTLDEGPAQFSVFTPQPGEIIVLNRDAADTIGESGSITSVSYDVRNGIKVSRATRAPAAAVETVPYLEQSDFQDVTGHDSISTDNGLLRQRLVNGNQVADLTTDDLRIAHFAGRAFGSAIANMGNDRTIDTQTVISIRLDDVNPAIIGSAMLRVEGIGITALRSRL